MAGPAVEGWASPSSASPGERVALHCAGAAPRVTIEVARIGAEREVVWRRDDVPVEPHPVPDDAAQRGCGWPATVVVDVEDGWRSGYYEVVFRAPGAEPGHAFLVVRAARPGRDTSIVLALSTNTWCAYDDWGGPNLYMGASRVSFERPLPRGFLARPAAPNDRLANAARPGDRDVTGWIDYLVAHGVGAWSGAAGWYNWERRFVAWAEARGHRLDFLTSLDLHRRRDVLDPYRLYLSVGHDEYWSWEMRDTVEGFVARGGNAAFFSGNTAFWQVRFEDGDRTMVSWKDRAPAMDPVVGTAAERRMTGMWSHPRIGRPENALTGVSFCRGGYARIGGGVPDGSGGYTVHRPEHWVFAGTGLRWGDVLGAEPVVVGYETDGCALRLVDGRPVPTHEDGTPRSFVVLATSPARLWSNGAEDSELPAVMRPGVYAPGPDGQPPGELELIAEQIGGDRRPETVARFAHGHCVMGVHEAGGTVFTTGCTDWAYGLGRDARVDRVTDNVIERLRRR
ncbi:MAG TPA: N,N-dimethylformamidase beta subunit family domain-containing protein [Candidatus Binatia bacterium]|nr:N,N-dimethylformamidase beta subunit family domain-containing protein [Candidatus Binatia bacterium]